MIPVQDLHQTHRLASTVPACLLVDQPLNLASEQSSCQSSSPGVLSPRPRFALSGLMLAVGCLLGMVAEPAAAQTASPTNPILKIGIVQRFGDEARELLTLQPVEGDRLSLRFKTGEQDQTITTAGSVKVGVTMEPLPQPAVVERVVLSTHRSFESAEDSADKWRSRGIEVELAQPRQWQVWAKRDTYSNPLVRRLLLKNLQAQGARTAFIDTTIERAVPRATIELNGTRMMRDDVEIVSSYGRVFVTPSNPADAAEPTEERRLYGGSLRLQPNAYGNYTLVNYVPTETYLRGVVPHEIGLRAPENTIQAQAILARTYALRNLRRFEIDGYQLCADTQCQVYRGLTGTAEVSDRAILATRGMVLIYRNELIDALYSSTTGGVTARFTDVWNGTDRPYLRSVVDSVQGTWNLELRPLSDEANLRAFLNLRQGFNETDWDTFRWRKDGSLTQIATDLRKFLQSQQHALAGFSRVEAVRVVERSPAGRVQKLAIQTNLGTVELEKDEILRAVYAPDSTLFYLEPIFETVPLVRPSPNATKFPATAPDAAASSPPGLTDGTPSSVAVAAKTIDKSSSLATSPQTQQVLKGYSFVGGGLGHAVGMSQTGAYNLGRLGWSATRILSFYYPGAQLVPLSDRIVTWRPPVQPPAEDADP